jgi:hypothetical protein
MTGDYVRRAAADRIVGIITLRDLGAHSRGTPAVVRRPRDGAGTAIALQ